MYNKWNLKIPYLLFPFFYYRSIICTHDSPNNIYIFIHIVHHLYLQYVYTLSIYNSTNCPRSEMYHFTGPYKVSALYKVTVYRSAHD